MGVPQALSYLELAQFRLRLRMLESAQLPPFLGSALRGGFGRAFRGSACLLKRKDCSGCTLALACPYAYVFETPVESDSEFLAHQPNAPHPFVIEPLPVSAILREGERLEFRLVLIGKAVPLLPYFVHAFKEFGRLGIGKERAKFHLQEVSSIGLEGRARGIWHGTDSGFSAAPVVVSGEQIAEQAQGLNPARLTLEFQTPARLKHQGELSSYLEFELLARSLLRRISLLSYYHCGRRLELDFDHLLEQASRVRLAKSDLVWLDLARYSSRQARKVPLGGLVGRVCFEGDLGAFLGLLTLGEWVHVGKGAVFGLGKYVLVPEC